MAKGAAIIVSGQARGVFKEGIINGTPKPGQMMTIKPAVAPVGSVFTWEAFLATNSGSGGTVKDAVKRLVTVLLGDDLQGSNSTTAYVSGARGYLYCPAPGEDLNMLVADFAGTSSASELIAIGDLFCAQNGTGKLIKNTLVNTRFDSGFLVPDSLPWTAKEATTLATDYTTDTLTWMMFNGQ